MQNAPGEHSAILLSSIKLSFSIMTLVLSIFKWPLKTDFTYTYFDITGGSTLDSGFRGCMRNIEVGAVPVDLELIPNSEKRMVTIGACKIKDRCTPNPCEHGGRCTQDWHNFFCDCDSTGYKGSVCHVCK